MNADEEGAYAFVREASLGIPGSIKTIADYLLVEGSGISALTMAQIAARTHTSKPTLVRFAQLAGYKGWVAFRHDFLIAATRIEQAQATRVSVDVNHPFEDTDDATIVKDAILHINALAADEVKRGVDADVLDRAIETIADARLVVLIGAAQNRRRAQMFASTISHIKILCQVPSSSETASILQLLDARDAVLAISYSGSLKRQPFLWLQDLNRQVPVIAITNSLHSELAEYATCALTFAPLEHLHNKIGPFYSGAATSLILDMLIAGCYARRYDRSRDAQATLLKKVKDVIPDDFPEHG